MQRRVTLRHVAESAGVSTTTASLVLNRRTGTRISEDTAERVRRCAATLGYRPNLVAHGLLFRRTKTLGLIATALATDPYASAMVVGAEWAARQRDHLLFVAETLGDDDMAHDLVHRFVDQGVDGFVFATAATRLVRVPTALADHPLVLLNCVDPASTAPCVVPDDEAAGRAAAHALLEAGHREGIVVVGEVTDEGTAGRLRRDGLRGVLAERGLRPAAELACPWWPEPTRHAVTAHLGGDGGRGTTAFVAMNDRCALGVYQAMGRHGWRAPADASILAFDGSDLAAWLDPGLTSLAIPYRRMGRRAVELLLAQVQAGRCGGPTDLANEAPVERFPLALHRRASLGPPRR